MDSMFIPWTRFHGFHGTVHGMNMEWDFIRKFTKSHMDSMFIPWTGFHGFHGLHLESIWNHYLGTCIKDRFKIYILFILKIKYNTKFYIQGLGEGVRGRGTHLEGGLRGTGVISNGGGVSNDGGGF